MNVGLIGSGYWGTIIKPKLINICDLKFVANSKTNYTDLLDQVEWVFVCSSTKSHYDIVKTCLNANKHVFCEKPFTGDYDKAKELIDLAHDKNLNLFIDNIFLYREESLHLHNTFEEIKFIWNKSEDIKQNIYDSLLYHDIYLLLHTTGIEDWKVVQKNEDIHTLNLVLKFQNQTASFNYNRNMTYKEKFILLDHLKIDYSSPKTDPLSNIINQLKMGNIDYSSNHVLTLKCLHLLRNIRNYVNG
jgi:hypothetical protein